MIRVKLLLLKGAGQRKLQPASMTALSTLTNDVHAEEEKSCWDALQVEMTSSRPRRDIFLPLMKKTFIMRRHFIIHNASSVHDILRDYPALKEPSAIEQEMELILSRPGMLRTFTAEWKAKWVPAVTAYCKGLKRKEICQVFSKHDSSSLGDENDEKIAVILLVSLFSARKQTDPKKQQRGQPADVLNYLYERCLIGEDPNVVSAQPPVRNSPRLAEFVVEDGNGTYFLFMEQMTVCEVNSFTKALFLWFCTHYVFHLNYCPALSDLCTFIQEFVFGLPCAGKRSATYLSIATDIQQITVR